MRNSLIPVLGTCVALLCAGNAGAQVTTVSGSGVLTAFPGFGYTYTASWESSAGAFQFRPIVSTQTFANDPNKALMRATGTFEPVGPTTLDVPSFDFSASVEFRFINTATGLPALPELLTRPNSSNLGVGFENFSTVVKPSELRFSHSLNETTYAFTDGAGNAVPAYSFPQAALTTVRLDIIEVFRAGQFLTASPDPSCASFACMVPGHDAVVLGSTGFNFEIATGPIPEPESLALMLGGLIAVGWVARRRRG